MVLSADEEVITNLYDSMFDSGSKRVPSDNLGWNSTVE